MALSPQLNLRMGQSLVMTPKLQQAIKLLQMSNLELSEFIEEELQKNPLLEREDASEFAKADTSELDGIFENSEAQFAGPELIKERSSETSFDTAPVTGNSVSLLQGHSVYDFDSHNPQLINSPLEGLSLREHLLKQANVDLADSIDRLIATYLIDSLDDSGYLVMSLEDLSLTLGCPISRVENILKVVQDFDPPGIFARNLSECLGLQLKDLDRYDPVMRAFLENLDLLEKNDFGRLKQVCGVDSEELVEIVKEIKALNPKPALVFDNTVTQTVTPDVFFHRRKDGSWFVELNTDTLPQILVNNLYYTKIKSPSLGEKDKTYITECYQSANWLVRALHQRAQTITKVATKIMQHQEEFLEKGVQFLKPLTLREIAEILKIHESTVSRVTNNKYISTPRGTFELKYFFSSSIRASISVDTPSAKSVGFQIKNLIKNEMPDKTLSDDKIVKILNDDGINIARRTVTKYRESMDIPSSVQRRRDKTVCT